ncbi:hypothetical protein [Nocardia sp. CA-290969]|uniref:hypothetical protein n=1 Tax=Nocardia sp. CA-290969 TaxID=3239986 RepID=UPI003D93456E
MPDGQSSTSLLTRSRRLTDLARNRREGAENTENITRTNTALQELAKELTSLDASLKLYTFLVEKSIADDLSIDLTKAPRDLRDHIDHVGRPTPHLLHARRRDASKVRQTIDASASSSWANWSQERLNELPLSRMALLGPRKMLVDTTVRDMKQAASKPPTVAGVETFLSKFASVNTLFDELGPTSELDAVLAKFPCRLSDLSDADIILLRSHGIDSQISLRME